MDENKLLERITVNPKIFGGKPIGSLPPPESSPTVGGGSYFFGSIGVMRMVSILWFRSTWLNLWHNGSLPF